MKMNKLSCAAAAVLMAGCCCLRNVETEYADRIDEGFVSLFDGETFANYAGDTDAYTYEANQLIGQWDDWRQYRKFYSDANAMVLTTNYDGKAKGLWTKDSYDNFVLRFNYLVTSNSNAAVGLRTPSRECPFGKGVALKLPDTHHVVSPWNFAEVRAVGDTVALFVNGFKVEEVRADGKPAAGSIVFLTAGPGRTKWARPRVKRVPADWRADGCPSLNRPPEGFTALFDGKSLANWKGVTAKDKFFLPWVRWAATPEKRAEMQKLADESMRRHWSVREGTLFFDGRKGGYSLATAKNYGDFELWCDWRLQTVGGDSGLYPRGVCQIQIWDAHDEWHLGSGGLYNNKVHPSNAMEIADNPAGDWNRFHIVMKGDRITVWLNGRLVVDNVVLENAYGACLGYPGPIPASEQLELQCHGDPLEFRNVFIREL